MVLMPTMLYSFIVSGLKRRNMGGLRYDFLLQIRDTAVGRVTWMAMSRMDGMTVE
jgi:hypothetical protein